MCGDWRERIHTVPGCGRPFLLMLALRLSMHGAKWLHWSEPSNARSRYRVVTQPIRRLYAVLNNRFGCGALAIGDLASRDFVRWGINADRIRFLPYSIAPVRASSAIKERKAGEGGVRFLFLGEICENKAVDVLVAAFHRVHSTYPDASLSLIGRDSSNGIYRRLVERLALAGCVQFRVSVPATNVGDVIAEHDVLVLPSRHDGWGMVLAEGASMARALIATESCGAAFHVIDDGVAGYRVRSEDPIGLADAMTKYCRAPETISLHGARCRELFAALAPERNAVRLRDALAALCGALAAK